MIIDMVKIIFSLFFLFHFTTKGLTQPANCSNNYEIVYHSNKNKLLELKNIHENQVLICFFSGFKNDTILVYQNNKLIRKSAVDNFKSVDNKGCIILNKKKKYDVLKFVILGKDKCLEFPIQKDFKKIAISFLEENKSWVISYSNYGTISE